MHYDHRNIEADAKFIESGGLKNWGCFGFFVAFLVLVLLFVLLRLLLAQLIGGPAALWVTLVILAGLVGSVVFFWLRLRRKKKREQEQIWQQALRSDVPEREMRQH